jgi:hypothetical protein
MDHNEYEDYNLEDDDDDLYEPEEDEEEEMEFELEDALERLAEEEEDNEVPAITLADLLSTGLSTWLRTSMNNLGLPSPTGSDDSARRLSLLARLRSNPRRSIVVDDDDELLRSARGSGFWFQSVQPPSHYQYSAPMEPQPAGVELSQSGAFGNPDATLHKQPLQKSLRDAKRSLSLPLKKELFNVRSLSLAGSTVDA